MLRRFVSGCVTPLHTINQHCLLRLNVNDYSDKYSLNVKQRCWVWVVFLIYKIENMKCKFIFIKFHPGGKNINNDFSRFVTSSAPCFAAHDTAGPLRFRYRAISATEYPSILKQICANFFLQTDTTAWLFLFINASRLMP